MFSSYLGYLTKEILTFSNLLQTSGTFIGLALAYLISYLLHQTRAKRMLVKLTSPHLNLVIDAIAFPFFWCLFQWTVVAACQEFSLEDKISATIAQFATAWLAVRFLTTFKAFSHSTWSLSIVIFLITTLNALGLLHRLVEITENRSEKFLLTKQAYKYVELVRNEFDCFECLRWIVSFSWNHGVQDYR